MKGYIETTILAIAIGALTLATSCNKDNNSSINNPHTEVDSTYHVAGLTIDSGFVFGNWTLVCHKIMWASDLPPYETVTTNDCSYHPIYEFKPNGISYLYRENGYGEGAAIDSFIYRYRNISGGSALEMFEYTIEPDSIGNMQYVFNMYMGAEHFIGYRNDSMFWDENTGGMAYVLRSFVKAD